MLKPSKARWAPLAYLLAALVLLSDQLAKYWLGAVFHLADRGVVDLIGPIRLRLIWNRGISFGFFQDYAPWTRWGLAGFSLIVATAIAVWARRIERPLPAIAAGLLIGGAIGNLLDRVREGAVMDFIDASGLHFPWIFNLADSAISIGVVLLLADSVLPPKRRHG